MNEQVKKAIEGLTDELNHTLQKASELKKMVNQLHVLNGEAPPFPDADFSPIGRNLSVLPDQFFGKGFSPSVKEYLRMKGRAATAQEITEALSRGGFEFPENWKDENRLKNVAITLSKNRYDFIPVPIGDGSAFGLWEFYPEKVKEREKKQQTSKAEQGEGLGVEIETSDEKAKPRGLKFKLKNPGEPLTSNEKDRQ